MTRRKRVILSHAERAFEGHDVVLPSARTWPGSSGLGWVPPWLKAWPVTIRGSPRDEPRDDPRDCTDGCPEQRKRKSRWVNARRVPERTVYSLGVKDSPAPAPRCHRGQALRQRPRIPLSACSKGFPARSGPVTTPCNGPCPAAARPSTQSCIRGSCQREAVCVTRRRWVGVHLGRTASSLPLSVARHRRTVLRKDRQTAILATSARHRQRRRWPVACRPD